jgi:adenosylmethionine-8-amino-7-oxononanoate aminotransferase
MDVRALDRAHLWHPYTQHGIAPEAVPVVRGRGSLLELEDGSTLVDAISSWWVTLHGHGEPAIARAIAAQAETLEQVIFAGFTHAPAAALAQGLVAAAPRGLTRVFLSDNGSTAVEVALKMALQFHQHRGEKRTVVAALEGAYHGDTFGAMSVSGRGVFTAPFEQLLFEVARLPEPVEGDVLSAFDRLLSERKGEVAALIVEPLLLAAGGMRMWRSELLGALADRARAAGVLLIADEVATGFGRTGPLFACEHAAVTPDLMCLSKGITGGFLPLGATLATERLFEAFVSEDRRRTFFHGHSYTGNPLACAAAVASLELLRRPECARARDAIEAQHRRYLDILATHPRVENPRVMGTVAALDLRVGEGEGYLANVGSQLARHARAQGVLLRPLGNVVYLMPPYGITEGQLQQAWDAVESFVRGLP